jgi:hypothetical protein
MAQTAIAPGTRRRFRSRSEEHDAIDELAYEPGREEVPLSPKRRKDLHAAADDRWDKMKRAGQERIRTTREDLADFEDKIVRRYTLATKALENSIEQLKDGDLSIEAGDDILEDCGVLKTDARTLEGFLATRREEADAYDTSDPEAHEFERVSEEYDRYPMMKTNVPHPTEVDW